MFDFLTNVGKVETLTSAEILYLIENRVPENKRLDYKLKFAFEGDKEKSEFLKDVTAMYNTEGGVLIFGLQEQKVDGSNTGIPELPTIPGHVITNLEKIKLDITSCIKTGINPAVNVIYFSPLLDVSGHIVFAIGIPKNNGLPAMVTKAGINSFYRRDNTQKYVMDTVELYQAFMRYGGERRDIEAFIDKRQDEIYLPYLKELRTAPQVVVHLIPADHFQSDTLPAFFEADFREFAQKLFDPYAYGIKNKYAYGFQGLHLLGEQDKYNTRFNLDGVLLFRNGIIEVINTTLFNEWTTHHVFNGVFQAGDLARMLIRYIEGMLIYTERLEIASGFYLSIRLRNLGRASLVGPQNIVEGRFDQPGDLNFPLWLITGASEIENVLNMLFDILYQAVGEPECPRHYKDLFRMKFSALPT